MNKYHIILCLFFFNFLLVKAQINTYSPYSYFAIGQLHPVGNNYNISMGGMGTSLMPQKYINYINPAAYSFLDRTVFEFGMRSSFISMSKNNLRQRNFISGLNTIGLAFPISKKISLSASLLPYSSVGYNLTLERQISEFEGDIIANEITEFSGAGGINKFLVGAAFNVFENFSIGANINYLFGSITKEAELYSNQDPRHFRDISDKTIRGINFDLGLLYSRFINNYKYNIGFTIKPGKDISTQTTTMQVFSGPVYDSGSSPEYDPYYELIDSSLDQNQQTHLPLESSVGISLQANEKWLIGLDYRYINWENFQENSMKLQNIQNSNEIILGGFFTPKKDDIYNYFNRVEYRWGLSYSTGYLLDNDTQNNALQHFSGTLGFGLPINRVTSKANLALKYGVINNINSISEQYFSIYLSMTLNEKWFQKIKIQ